MVANTGLIADGFRRFAARQSAIHTSPGVPSGRSWLVIAIMTMSGLAVLYALPLTTTEGRCFDAVWFVNGNGTKTTSPNS